MSNSCSELRKTIRFKSRLFFRSEVASFQIAAKVSPVSSIYLSPIGTKLVEKYYPRTKHYRFELFHTV